MSATDKLKDELKKANPSDKWAEKIDRMRPDQVEAIYTRLRLQGKVKK